MSTKRKPHQDNKTRQNSKNSFKPLLFNKRSNSDLKLNLREEDVVEFCAELPQEDTDNSSDCEDDKTKKEDLNPIATPKKKKNVPDLTEESFVTPKIKHRREPLPMKFRAFPQSFWQQPNKTPLASPGTVYCVPLPLSKEDSTENRETLEEVQPPSHQEIVSKPNIDLLFSLFRNVEEEQQKALGQRNVPLIRRGRPKKTKTELKVIRDDDPYLTSSAAESLLPLLPVRNNLENLQYKIAKDEQILAMVSIDGSSSNIQPTNTANQNYSQILSELVVQL